MLEIKNVKKVYNPDSEEPYLALKNICFKIEDGEFVAIMGPSGSGKSTLMNILGCLDMPTSGQYIFDGKDISKLDPDQLADIRRDKIGFVFQSFNLLKRSTVIRNVMLPLLYSNTTEEYRLKVAKKSLLAVGINESHFFHLSNQISGGQMQRVAIARALVNNPSIILADEPTGNLDSKTGDIVLNTFKQLNREHKNTIILITHEMDVALHADRIIVIRDGEIVEDKKVQH